MAKQSTPDAIQSLIGGYGEVVEDPRNLGRSIWKCRSRLVHGVSSGDFDLRSMAGKALALVRMALLEKLGFTKPEIVLMVRSNAHVWGWLYAAKDAQDVHEANEELQALRGH